jgi:hypothetical protein
MPVRAMVVAHPQSANDQAGTCSTAAKSMHTRYARAEAGNVVCAVYQVGPAGDTVGAKLDECRGGKVVGVANPVLEPQSLGIQQREATAMAGKELQDILRAVTEPSKPMRIAGIHSSFTSDFRPPALRAPNFKFKLQLWNGLPRFGAVSLPAGETATAGSA